MLSHLFLLPNNKLRTLRALHADLLRARIALFLNNYLTTTTGSKLTAISSANGSQRRRGSRPVAQTHMNDLSDYLTTLYVQMRLHTEKLLVLNGPTRLYS